MSEQSKLERIGIEQRENLVARSIYNTSDSYSVTHTRAISDDETPIPGKGTGLFLDTENGGGSYDINGVPGSIMSGRTSNLSQNIYNKESGYQTPDTSGNIGQITF